MHSVTFEVGGTDLAMLKKRAEEWLAALCGEVRVRWTYEMEIEPAMLSFSPDPPKAWVAQITAQV